VRDRFVVLCSFFVRSPWLTVTAAAGGRRSTSSRRLRPASAPGRWSDPPGADAVGCVVPVGAAEVDVAGEVDQRAVGWVDGLARGVHVRHDDRGAEKGVAGREGA